jgi:hypothetical protein
MASGGVSDDLRDEGERVLTQFIEGEMIFADYDFSMTPFMALDFPDWVLGQDGDISELKTLLPGLDEERQSYIFQNPDEIAQDELFEWARNLYPEPDSDATMYVFVPIETDNSEKGLAVIKSYGDIPGGEYELFDVFVNQEEADKALEGKFWF